MEVRYVQTEFANVSVHSRVIPSCLDEPNAIKHLANASRFCYRRSKGSLRPFLRFHAPILELFGVEQTMTQLSYRVQ